uniref:NADH-ubiquinone oxidoreductase chain 6 n=1 Tax=Callosobruchus maculatus TaxID=64391 RepID=A0A7M3UIR8_CALMS|nr:NADH dehydrogenase subunit 6 [Callosobruchus maculatus]YP_010876301.1 NADH dehydrogenase subunit 6 [Bruchus pisorum]QOH99483.1 NADH dehydrogenase subunit 6 [Callosobruchus maculatus]WHE17352.1 NADH dehydrogenase subunit 6 [Bruchus pisorum]
MSLMMFIMMMSMMFMFLNHPLSMGMILLIQTILTALMTGLMNYNFWFSYILFLIMIGGMLILFIYMTSIASNEKFKFSMKMLNMMIINFSILMLLILFMDQYFFSTNLQTMDFFMKDTYINYYLSLNKYFNYPNNLILYLMINYLLITLIMVVKITNINYGPMRQMN